MDHNQDIFYNVSGLSIDQKKSILIDAKNLSTVWWVDQLKGWRRERLEIDFDQILQELDKESHFVFIHRRGFKDLPGQYIIETGFSTFTNPNKFLFIYCDLEHLPFFIEKYKLEIFPYN